jgi:isopenicillin N synthase-like dioxygenase
MGLNSEIPSIDFGPFLHGSARDREDVASTLDAALRSVGFIYLRNHGIDQRKVDECFNWVSGRSYTYAQLPRVTARQPLNLADDFHLQSKRFFALPEPEKNIAWYSPDRSYHRGYSGVGNEKVRGRICIKECFDSGNPEDDTQPDVWPSEELLPGFRKFMEIFFQVQPKEIAVCKVSIITQYSRGLGLH